MIPIFVIVFDRITVLKQAVKSWISLIETPVEIVFIDNGSTFPETVKWLKKVEKHYPVYWNKIKKNDKNSFCANIPGFIKSYLEKKPSEYYIVSDPDIMLDDNIDSDILEVFKFLLKKTSAVCVGPSLRIDDIPDHYPLKHIVLKRQHQFWPYDKSKINKIKFKDKIISYKRCPIDTTFAMYRSEFSFRRHNTEAIRVFAPYLAKHLDWYIDPNAMALDQIYYTKHANTHSGISHWTGVPFQRAVNEKARNNRQKQKRASGPVESSPTTKKVF